MGNPYPFYMRFHKSGRPVQRSVIYDKYCYFKVIHLYKMPHGKLDKS